MRVIFHYGLLRLVQLLFSLAEDLIKLAKERNEPNIISAVRLLHRPLNKRVHLRSIEDLGHCRCFRNFIVVFWLGAVEISEGIVECQVAC